MGTLAVYQSKFAYLSVRSDLEEEEAKILNKCSRNFFLSMQAAGFSTFLVLWCLKQRFGWTKSKSGDVLIISGILFSSFAGGMLGGAYSIVKNDETIHPLFMKYQFDDPNQATTADELMGDH